MHATVKFPSCALTEVRFAAKLLIRVLRQIGGKVHFKFTFTDKETLTAVKPLIRVLRKHIVAVLVNAAPAHTSACSVSQKQSK